MITETVSLGTRYFSGQKAPEIIIIMIGELNSAQWSSLSLNAKFVFELLKKRVYDSGFSFNFYHLSKGEIRSNTNIKTVDWDSHLLEPSSPGERVKNEVQQSQVLNFYSLMIRLENAQWATIFPPLLLFKPVKPVIIYGNFTTTCSSDFCISDFCYQFISESFLSVNLVIL